MLNIREGGNIQVSSEPLSKESVVKQGQTVALREREDIIDINDDPTNATFIHVKRRRVNVGSAIVNTFGGLGTSVAGGAIFLGLPREAAVMVAVSTVAFVAARVLRNNP